MCRVRERLDLLQGMRNWLPHIQCFLRAWTFSTGASPAICLQLTCSFKIALFKAFVLRREKSGSLSHRSLEKHTDMPRWVSPPSKYPLKMNESITPSRAVPVWHRNYDVWKAHHLGHQHGAGLEWIGSAREAASSEGECYRACSCLLASPTFQKASQDANSLSWQDSSRLQWETQEG